MEDLDFNVEISDCDWECFLKECEECNLLSPALAGIDDSGLSDISSGSLWSKSTHPGERTCGLDPTAADSPLDDTGATLHHGGLSSILSGSEEDIHLRSVNMFFERMAGGMESKEAGDDTQSSSRDRLEAKQVAPGNSSTLAFCISAQPADQKTSPWNVPPQLKGSRSKNVLTAPWRPDTQSSLEMATNIRRGDGQMLDESQIKAQEWSPSASFKRKRRKKRRLNLEAVERKGFFRQSDSEEEQRSLKLEAKGLTALQSESQNRRHHPSHGNEDIHNNDFASPCHETNLQSVTTLGGTAAYSSENLDGNSGPTCEIEDTSTSASSILATVHTHVPSLDLCRNDNLPTGKSVVAVKVENAGNQQLTLCDTDSDLQQQPEPDGHNKDQYSPPEKKPAPLLEEGPILDFNLSAQEATTLGTVCKCNVLSEIHGLIEPNEKMDHSGSSSPPAVINTTNDNLKSDDVATCSSDVLCCYTQGLQTAPSLFDANNPHVSLSSLATVGHVDSIRQGHFKNEGETVSASECQDSVISGTENEEVDTASSYKGDPQESTQTVFAMSSFWREMEKLTINDILGLRMINRGAQPLQALQEDSDSELSIPPNRCQSGVQHCDAQDLKSHPIRSVTWENEPITMSLGSDLYYPGSAIDILEPLVSEGSPKCLRKMSKNVSVQNLHALESLSDPCDRDPLQGARKVTSRSGGVRLIQEDVAEGLNSSAMESCKISLTNIFQYFFGKKLPVSSQATMETTDCTAATSLPESYDLFFSEFDTKHFFYPLMKSDDTHVVPIFSCHRSSTMQFPEVYDSLFASSSSDDSSGEEEDASIRQPLRVITRWSDQASQTSTDIYDNFFSDSDVRQNFFWRSGLSFRNLKIRGSSAEKQVNLSSASRGWSRKRMFFPTNILGNGRLVGPDPLLLHLEDRINSQLMKPLRHENLLLSNPRLQPPLLLLRQSDMCLICIAFASWVLKTTNPQGGDTWKAVLLANISALSAIRYVRKYMKLETSEADKKLHATDSSESLCL